MRIALAIEIEELIFDTLAMRAQALHSALAGGAQFFLRGSYRAFP